MKTRRITLYESIVQMFVATPRKGLKSYLVRGSAGALVLKVSNTGLVLVSGILLARLLGVRGYGNYAYAMALVQVISVPVVMGLPQFIVRAIAAYHVQKNFGRMRGLLVRANQFVFGVSILLAVVAAGLAIVFADRLDVAGWQTFLISLMLLPLLGLNNLRMAALRGLRHVVTGLMPEMIIRPVLFILLIVAGYFILPNGISPQAAMSFQVLATGVAFIALFFLLARLLPVPAKNAESIYETRAWLKSILPFMLLGAMQLINNRIDIIMLGIFCPIEDVGIYRAVVQGSTLVIFVLAASNQVLAPVISGLYAENDIEKLQRLVTISARFILAGTLPIVLFLYIGGPWLLSALFGAEFATGAFALRILCVGQLVNATMGSVGIILNMTGHEKYAVRGVAIAAIANIGLNALLIPPFGLSGAAAATAISLVIWNLLLAWWVYNRVGVLSTAFGRFGF